MDLTVMHQTGRFKARSNRYQEDQTICQQTSSTVPKPQAE